MTEAPSPAESATNFLRDFGDAATLIAAFNWETTSLGPIAQWSPSLKALVGFMVRSPVAMAAMWGEEGILIYNDGYARFAGNRHPEQLGQPVITSWPEAAEFNANVLKTGLAGETLSYRDQEFTLLRHGEPETLWLNLDYSPLLDDSGAPAGVMAIVVETTEKVLLERRQATDAERQRRQFEQAPGFVIIMNGPDHTVEFVNDTHKRVFGSDDWIGKPIRQAFPSIAGQGFYELLDDVYGAGETYQADGAEVRYRRRPDGPEETRYLDFIYAPITNENGAVTGIFCDGFDITNAREAREALTLSEARYRSLFESMGEGFCIIEAEAVAGSDLVDFRYVAVNPAFETATGIPNPFGTTLRAVLPGEAQPWVDTYSGVLASGKPLRFERGLLAQGRVLELYAFRVEDGSGRRVGVIFSDVTARKTAEEARSLSEERLRLVIEGAKDHAILTTDDNGVITSWSAGAETIFGWTSEEAIGLSASIIFTPEDRAQGQDRLELEKAAKEGYAPDERWHVCRDGRRVFMNGSVRPLPAGSDGRARGFLKIARDETARRETDEELRFLNADLERQVIERSSERGTTWQISPLMLCVIDLTTGRFVRVNPSWTTVLGYEPGEIIGRQYLEFLHPDEVERSMAAFAEVESGNPVLDFENRYRAKSGEYRWLSWVAVPEGGKLYSTVRDVTTEKAAKAEREKFYEITRDLIGVVGFDGYLKSVNPAWARALGRSEAELLASPFSVVIHPDDLARTGEVLTTLMSGQPVHQFHVRLLAADGQPIAFAWSASPDASPETGLFYTVGRDITEDVAKATELQQTQEALRQAQKMEAVGQLTGGIAHDFNNLLAGISGSLELMQKRITSEGIAGFDRHIGIAKASAHRAAALTQRLLAFARRQTLDPKVVDANRLIKGMEDLFRRSVGPQVEIGVVEAVGLWPTRVDAAQLESALLNLVINARDAMPDGGRITLETANKWIDDRTAKERDLSSGQYISVCVTDTGTGMTPDVIEKAFDPFYTTKPLGQGTGLGLSMIHGFIRQSGGQVRVYSEVGQGTTMCLYLPRHVGTVETAEDEPPTGKLEQGLGETVLVIDDEDGVRMLITDVLDEAGYHVLEAIDGPSGLKILQSDVRIDLLITDVGLPGGANGRQVADAARVTRPDLKVLFVTGYADNAVLGNGHLDPGMQVITKPFPMADLALRVREIIEA